VRASYVISILDDIAMTPTCRSTRGRSSGTSPVNLKGIDGRGLGMGAPHRRIRYTASTFVLPFVHDADGTEGFTTTSARTPV